MITALLLGVLLLAIAWAQTRHIVARERNREEKRRRLGGPRFP